ncbi:hypothetical protein A3B51_02295 [Candidatus Curtissbacteria bacterium RIFCSPLOWO2_01_FULL_41_18]|uniref:Peptidase S9 prolyl oligopeptidase catalytic domain-containing protein n=2 Tax=Candidatus Curtissiibacteriota TaxID=1752717 RepID=A0A1F5FY33_9BACT|nr:MAG: hypothetical protein A2696_02080 [Candidatus Curtissbacteria bacterium RIFCSPHIGHO2_01_FULL_41_13]OGE04394.1 MAG: hypothetical protein A3B51_02295 [Candidatus Curtissbacteria bacterium RIFCSPLOWO2_01_FULL_41_18]
MHQARRLLALDLKAPVSDYVEALSLKGNENRSRDFASQIADINIYKQAKNITCPVLIIHGSADNDVPISQSEKLLESLGGEKRLAIIHDAGHVMRGPFMQDAHNQLTEFFRQNLLK